MANIRHDSLDWSQVDGHGEDDSDLWEDDDEDDMDELDMDVWGSAFITEDTSVKSGQRKGPPVPIKPRKLNSINGKADCSTLPRPATAPKPSIIRTNSISATHTIEDKGPPKPSLIPSTGTIKRGPPTPKKRPPALEIDTFKVPPLPNKSKNCKAPPTPKRKTPSTPSTPLSPNKDIFGDFKKVNVNQLVKEHNLKTPSTPSTPTTPTSPCNKSFIRSISNNLSQQTLRKGPPTPPKKTTNMSLQGNVTKVPVKPSKVLPMTPSRTKVPPPTPVKVNKLAKDNSIDIDLDSIIGELSALETQLTISIEEEHSQSKPHSSTRRPTQPTSDEVNASLISALDELNSVSNSDFDYDPSLIHHTSSVRNVTRPASGINPTSRVSFQRPSSGVTLNGDVDSAYSDDNSSLPSSGSRVSVATSASSAHSASSSGVCISNTTSPTSDQGSSIDDKDAKVRVALEKIKEANIKKMFIRVETRDGTKRSILIDETMTVAQICDILAVKSRTKPSLEWSIVEQLNELYMERMMEDHEYLVDYLQSWSPDSINNLIYMERRDKYDILLRPERYLLCGTDAEDKDFNEDERNVLINEYFCSSQNKIPKMESYLYLKVDGKKVWKKIYCTLRFSGIYYNPKGKNTVNSKDLVCLQKLDFIEIFTAIGWKKKYKAPSEFGFALKHSRIQKVAAKYIRYLCAENSKTMAQWIAAIRTVKLGEQLVHNFESSKENIIDWDPNKVILEPITSETRHIRVAGSQDSSLIGCISVPQKFNVPMSPIKKQLSAQNTPLSSRRSNDFDNKRSPRSSSVDLLESCTIRRKQLPNMQLADITATTAHVLTRTNTDPDLLPKRSMSHRPSSCDMRSSNTMGPPAPPKRGLQTKLSFKSFSSQNSSNFTGSHSSISSNRTSHSDCMDGGTVTCNGSSYRSKTPVTPTKPPKYMVDLQRTIAKKQPIELESSDDDLPPPPPELLAQTKRIPPPTPPKRNNLNQTH